MIHALVGGATVATSTSPSPPAGAPVPRIVPGIVLRNPVAWFQQLLNGASLHEGVPVMFVFMGMKTKQKTVVKCVERIAVHHGNI